jgi:polysaccharide export outer membrane protein
MTEMHTHSAAAKPAALLILAAALLAGAGCHSTGADLPPQEAAPLASQTLRAGDVIKVTFPGSPSLDTTQTIRPDGRITMEQVGEVKAAGETPSELEKELLQKYSSLIVSKEISVSVVSATFPVFVSGAVIKPGKVESDHPITALEAVMEAGGFDSAKADTKSVVVIRQQDGRSRNFTLNLQKVLDGKSGESFYLRASDIVYVPEKFSWF